MNTTQNTTAPTFGELQEMKDAGKARVLQTAQEGTCQLVEVDGSKDNVVVLADNSTLWSAEDLQNDPVFPVA